MQSQVSSIIRSATRPESVKLNVLTFPTHERYQSNMAGVHANFFLLKLPEGNGVKTGWNTTYADIPKNHTLITDVPRHIKIDVLLAQHKFGQFQHLKQLSVRHRLPLIVLEHTCPTWPDKSKTEYLKTMRGEVNLFISDWSRKQWLWTDEDEDCDVIVHGIDSDYWKPDREAVKFNPIERNKTVLTVCNDFINRDQPCGFNIWRQITNGLPVTVVGETPGLSKGATPAELLKIYQYSAVYINPAPYSPIPTSLLEAMSCGCAPVSLAACMVPEIIQHGKNGFISNNLAELNGYCRMLLNDDKLREDIGANARQTIIDKFGLDKFVENWNRVLKHTVDMG